MSGPGGPTAAFLVVGGLLLDLQVRRLLRGQGTVAPAFGGASVWLAEGDGAAGRWFARVTGLPGRGWLVRFGRPDAPDWERAAADPEAAPALPAAREPALRELCEALGWSVVHLVEDALPALDHLRRRVPGGEDEGAFLAWAYSLAVDEALNGLAASGQAAYLAGDTWFTLVNQDLLHVHPFPSGADACYLLSYPLTAFGLLLLVRRRAAADRAGLLDALMVATAAGVLSWTYLLAPQARGLGG